MLEWETLPTFPRGAHKLALKHLDAYICILIRILYLLKAFTLELVMWHLLAWTYVLLIALICWFNDLWCWQVVVNISQWLKLGGKVRLAAGVLVHDVVHGVVAILYCWSLWKAVVDQLISRLEQFEQQSFTTATSVFSSPSLLAWSKLWKNDSAVLHCVWPCVLPPVCIDGLALNRAIADNVNKWVAGSRWNVSSTASTVGQHAADWKQG